MDNIYEVIVSNIGAVYTGDNAQQAWRVFDSYRTQSLNGYGKAGWETVTVLLDGEIILVHEGEQQ